MLNLSSLVPSSLHMSEKSHESIVDKKVYSKREMIAIGSLQTFKNKFMEFVKLKIFHISSNK